VGIHWATPDLFPTLGIALREGRLFTPQDRLGQPRVALVNETAARRFWPNGSPVGRTIAVGQGGFHEGAEVVGVVSDVRFRTLDTAPAPDVFVPLAQSYQSRMRLFVRGRVDRQGLVNAVRQEVRALDSTLPMSEIKTMEQRVADAMWRTRVGMWLLAAFSGLALLLTAIGVFGVMAEAVTQRTTEIGIRMALGAQPTDVLRLVLGRAAMLTAIGIAAGAAGSLTLTRVMASFLYDVEPRDPTTLGVVSCILAAVALLACYLPARRATRVDAVAAIKAQ
jgi:predicted permease